MTYTPYSPGSYQAAGQAPEAPERQPTVAPMAMGKFAASKAIVSESWAILTADKELLWFPVLSAIASAIILALAAALYFFVVLGGDLSRLQAEADANSAASYAWLFIYYLATFFVASFFQAGIYVIARARMTGGDLGFGDGMRGAAAHAGKIFAWSAVAATVGVILRVIGDKKSAVAKIVAAVLGAAWSILTYFSLPSLVLGDTTVVGSFKESVALIRKAWGEAAIVNLGVGFFLGVIWLGGLALALLVMLAIPVFPIVAAMAALLILFTIGLSIVGSALGSIFKAALYEYARTGAVPSGFSPELVSNAIQPKTR